MQTKWITKIIQSRNLGSRTIAPEENCLLDNCPLADCFRISTPRNFPWRIIFPDGKVNLITKGLLPGWGSCIARSLPKKVEIIEKFDNDKRDTQSVPLINFENDLTTSPNKIHSETDPKSDEQQQSHDNKQQIPSKELSENSKEKDGNKSQF